MSGEAPTVGIVGAGLAGLACARELASAGVSVVVLDKGRLPGGRAASRRPGRFVFPHGAARFDDEPEARADPRGRALEMAHDLDVRSDRVARALREAAGWRLLGDDGTLVRGLDTLVVTCPAQETLEILAGEPVTAPLARVTYAPRWSVLIGTRQPVRPEVVPPLEDVVRATPAPDDTVRALALFQASAGYVLRADERWSEEHVDDEIDDVCAALIEPFVAATGADVVWRDAHRWRYAHVREPVGEPFLFDAERRVGVCGDLCTGDGAARAVASGRALAARLQEGR